MRVRSPAGPTQPYRIVGCRSRADLLLRLPRSPGQDLATVVWIRLDRRCWGRVHAGITTGSPAAGGARGWRWSRSARPFVRAPRPVSPVVRFGGFGIR